MPTLFDVSAVVIFADDPRRLATWYKDTFALTEVFSSESFIGLRGERVTLFIQRTSEGHRPGMGGVRPHFTVEDCRAAHEELLDAGAREILAVTDVGQELVSAIQDPEDNPLGLLQIKRSR